MSNIKFDFSEKTALITGAGQGIGLQIVKDFISSGAHVIAWEKSKDNITELKKNLATDKLTVQEVDVSETKSCQKSAESLQEPIDFLVNNAGILRDKSFAKMTWEDYSSVIETNLNGVFRVTQSLLPHFNSENFKRIVNLSSVVALYGNFGQSNYVAAKAGVIGLTKVWARELAKKSFTVNAIAPGCIQTDIFKNTDSKILDSLISKIPVGRMGLTKDISQTCLFLCSKEASYINGAVLEVTGGLTV
ncbi:MAG: SDR family oxidoreductase [Bdellovibrionaceae bacterium]|nr:SDR family oxidoreductase [Pseudobdellovibrionaceae bacterium]